MYRSVLLGVFNTTATLRLQKQCNMIKRVQHRARYQQNGGAGLQLPCIRTLRVSGILLFAPMCASKPRTDSDNRLPRHIAQMQAFLLAVFSLGFIPPTSSYPRSRSYAFALKCRARINRHFKRKLWYDRSISNDGTIGSRQANNAWRGA